MASKADVLHRLIDAVTGVRNISPGEAGDLHDSVTPGYSTPPPSAEQVAAAQALIDKAEAAKAAAEAPADDDDEEGAGDGR